MDIAIWVVVAFVIIIIVAKLMEKQESFSNGAILQLIAKGPQDTYLTGDAWKPWWGYPYYPGYPWNAPTRSTKRGYYYEPIPYNTFYRYI